ncbi:hypothetical protein G5V59_17895 [Nocardioides sp. W3-2-3]|uniref:hypothetical protein n=1 Tax=Nocardioides convexus TaxID=2712224 RepID=UPI0024185873|nr:hypothetical protein [Nocardioides convexus]NHA01118.1 hypothetical protein [Nocardioides convexus]
MNKTSGTLAALAAVLALAGCGNDDGAKDSSDADQPAALTKSEPDREGRRHLQGRQRPHREGRGRLRRELLEGGGRRLRQGHPGPRRRAPGSRVARPRAPGGRREDLRGDPRRDRHRGRQGEEGPDGGAELRRPVRPGQPDSPRSTASRSAATGG